jgi:hypothetical protein
MAVLARFRAKAIRMITANHPARLMTLVLSLRAIVPLSFCQFCPRTRLDSFALHRHICHRVTTRPEATGTAHEHDKT